MSAKRVPINISRRRGCQDDSGDEWQYGLARFSDLKIAVRHQGRQVWEAPALELGSDVRRDPNEPYVLYPAK